jgi:hypothetical protein
MFPVEPFDPGNYAWFCSVSEKIYVEGVKRSHHFVIQNSRVDGGRPTTQFDIHVFIYQGTENLMTIHGAVGVSLVNLPSKVLDQVWPVLKSRMNAVSIDIGKTAKVYDREGNSIEVEIPE